MAAAMSPGTQQWLTAQEVADRAGVSIWTVYKWMREGVVTCRRLPRARPLALASDVDRMLRESVVAAK